MKRLATGERNGGGLALLPNRKGAADEPPTTPLSVWPKTA